MLDSDLKTQLAAYLEKLQQPIELVACQIVPVVLVKK